MSESIGQLAETVRNLCIEEMDTAKRQQVRADGFQRLLILLESAREPEKLVTSLQLQKTALEAEIVGIDHAKAQHRHELNSIMGEEAGLKAEIDARKKSIDEAKAMIEKGKDVARVLAEIRSGGNAVALGSELARLLG